MGLVAIAKYPNETANPNLLTRASFMELIEFERDILNGTYVEENFALCKPDPNRRRGRPSGRPAGAGKGKGEGGGKPKSKCPPKKSTESDDKTKTRKLNEEDSDSDEDYSDSE
jgi:hypothetical protein